MYRLSFYLCVLVGKALPVIAALLLCIACNAQETKGQATNSVPDTLQSFTPPREDTLYPQKDLYDVVKGLLHLKRSAGSDSIGVKPIFSVVPAGGYTLQSRLVGTLTGNVAFRTGPKARISTITASAAYSQNRQFTMPLESSIWTRNNRWDFVGDLRFYKYPQSTFGLGSNSWIGDEDPMDYSYVRASEIVLRHLKGNFYVGGGYVLDYHWNISEAGLKEGTPSDYSRYGEAGHTASSGASVNALYDARDNSINPSRGSYSALQYRNSLPALGSTSAWQSLIIDVRKYIRFPAASKNILALWSYDWLMLTGKPPYLDLPSNSWDPYSSTGRGYIQGRFRGSRMVYGEAEYRFGLTRNGLIGGVVFVNAESFSAAPGSALEHVQPGYGLGARIKLNKASRTNISIDYGFGMQGSHGLFINIGELF